MPKIGVAVLGACGALGQRYCALLENHPWFELKAVVGSDKTQGLTYNEAVQQTWHLPNEVPKAARLLHLLSFEELLERSSEIRLVFSALPNKEALVYEPKLAKQGLAVVSSASAHRMVPDIPLIIPEINPHHLALIDKQQKERRYKGFIVAKPNCTLQGYLLPLTPLQHTFGCKKLIVTTLQALSGGGLSALNNTALLNNVVPHIPDEEEKGENEPLKIFGSFEEGKITPLNTLSISAHCNRVPVVEGHLTCISAAFEKKPSKEGILEAWANFSPLPLPSSPVALIEVKKEPSRPQPKLDLKNNGEMGVLVGRLRPCPVLHYRFISLTHNTLRGGAGGGVLTAELLVKKGYLAP